MREQHGLTMEEKPGTQFGNYELVRRIDVGGMGEVYLAHQMSAFGRSVAVKIIRSDLMHDITARARFLREAEVSAHLKHEHILPMYDFGEVNGQLFMATPYIEGGTLATRLREEGTLSLKDTHTLFVPLVQAVAYIHRRGVVHRDLKPTNILLDNEDGEIYVRLIDFGIASFQGHSASPPLTTAGHEMGTIAYMAPERLSGIAAPSNDIFSLGVILHQMLAGQISMTSMSGTNTQSMQLPEPLARVIRRSVATNTAERYASADELLRAFEESYEQLTGPTQTRREVLSAASLNALQETRALMYDYDEPSSRSQLVSLALSGEIATPSSSSSVSISARGSGSASFTPEDYTAPTTMFGPTNQPPKRRKPIRPLKPRPTRKKSTLLAVISTGIAVLVLLIACMLYYGYQIVTAASISVNFAPRVQVVSQVFTLRADTTSATINVDRSSIPTRLFTVRKSEQQVGSTSGQTNCVFRLPITCQQSVSVDDVNLLLAQMQPDLQKQIVQELQTQVDVAGGIAIGQVNFFNQEPTSAPAIGMPSQTVTVNLSEQGTITYVLKGDATNLAHQLLTRAVGRLGQGYQVIDATTEVGTPQLSNTTSTDGQGSILISAGVAVRYHFTSSEIGSIRQGLAGKTENAGLTFLRSQSGIDPASVKIHFTSGKGPALPVDVQSITVIPLNPENVPSVSLTPVPTTTPANGSGE